MFIFILNMYLLFENLNKNKGGNKTKQNYFNRKFNNQYIALCGLQNKTKNKPQGIN